MKLKGADILIQTLLEQGTDTVFGYPGGCVLDIYDALYRNGQIRHVLTAHEQGASHAADGYARVTGKTGVVIATSGPGATNLVTGIATAYMDSVPLVAITGNVSVSMLGRDSFQEVDICGITMPITKHNFIVRDVNELADTVREAFYIAGSGRKGPVLIDIPKNVQQELCEYTKKEVKRYTPKPVAEESVQEVARAIDAAKKPVIMVGGGVIGSGAEAEVLSLAEKLRCPVVSTLMGLGGFAASHAQFFGMIGMHGTIAAAKAYLAADTLIVLGSRFSDRVALNRDSFGGKKTVIQIDIDAAEIDKNVKTSYSVMADIRATLQVLLPLLSEKSEDWLTEATAFRNLEKTPENGMAKRILECAAKIAPENTLVATDVGQHQMWTALYYPVEKPRTFCTSGGLGTMGYGMGAAIGACIGGGYGKTVLVTGDGSFNMNLNELSTAVTAALPLVILLMHNNTLGMVRQWQKLFYGRRFSQTTLEKKTDYVRFAESFGAEGAVIASEADIEPVLQRAFAAKGPFLVDCRIDIDDNVLPMIKPGQTYDTQIATMEE